MGFGRRFSVEHFKGNFSNSQGQILYWLIDELKLLYFDDIRFLVNRQSWQIG
jgi:hypothetical protein